MYGKENVLLLDVFNTFNNINLKAKGNIIFSHIFCIKKSNFELEQFLNINTVLPEISAPINSELISLILFTLRKASILEN